MFSSSPKPLKVPVWVESIELVEKSPITGTRYERPRVKVKAFPELIADTDFGPVEILYSVERNGDVINTISHRIEDRTFTSTSRTADDPFAHTVRELWDIDAAFKRRAASSLTTNPPLERVPEKPLHVVERWWYLTVCIILGIAGGAFIAAVTS